MPVRRALTLATRLSGTDGVGLEAEKRPCGP